MRLPKQAFGLATGVCAPAASRLAASCHTGAPLMSCMRGGQVVVAGSAIGEMAMHFIEQAGLMAVRIPSKFDLRRFCRCGRGSGRSLLADVCMLRRAGACLFAAGFHA